MGAELRQRVQSALRAVPGVTDVKETWKVTGIPSGEALTAQPRAWWTNLPTACAPPMKRCPEQPQPANPPSCDGTLSGVGPPGRCKAASAENEEMN